VHLLDGFISSAILTNIIELILLAPGIEIRCNYLAMSRSLLVFDFVLTVGTALEKVRKSVPCVPDLYDNYRLLRSERLVYRDNMLSRRRSGKKANRKSNYEYDFSKTKTSPTATANHHTFSQFFHLVLNSQCYLSV
jgi:hypothetical protein